jgi:Protein of unknown function (DUF2911)
MFKKILIGVGILAVMLLATFLFRINKGRTASPPGTSSITNGDLSVKIDYSRPSVKGRLIFGTKEQGALQPYGEYWRLGANESTEITVSKDVNFNGKPLKAGTYRMYAIPEEGGFEIVLNTELGVWGIFKPDHDLDILKTKITSEKNPAVVELYTISLLPIENGIDIVFEWSDSRWVVPITN